MGLFDFAKDIGEKLFDRDERAADRIEKRITENNPGVDQLKVDFDDGEVTLSGKAKDQAARDKAILIAGNVRGVSSVNASNLEYEKPRETTANADTRLTQKKEEITYYTIERGDTLSGIAKRYYGDAMKYPALFEANREVIKDPDLIYPGQKIRIPPLSATASL